MDMLYFPQHYKYHGYPPPLPHYYKHHGYASQNIAHLVETKVSVCTIGPLKQCGNHQCLSAP